MEDSFGIASGPHLGFVLTFAVRFKFSESQTNEFRFLQLIWMGMLSYELVDIRNKQAEHVKYHGASDPEGGPKIGASSTSRSFAEKIGLVG